MKAPGIKVNPIYQMTGKPGFNEVYSTPPNCATTTTSWGRSTRLGNRRPAELAYERRRAGTLPRHFSMLLELIARSGRSRTCATPRTRAARRATAYLRRMSDVGRRLCAGPARTGSRRLDRQGSRTAGTEAARPRARSRRFSSNPDHEPCHAGGSGSPSPRRSRPKPPSQGGTTEILPASLARGLGLR